jgi:hypothetical protein
MTLSFLATQEGPTNTSGQNEAALHFIRLFSISWLGKWLREQGFRRILKNATTLAIMGRSLPGRSLICIIGRASRQVNARAQPRAAGQGTHGDHQARASNLHKDSESRIYFGG